MHQWMRKSGTIVNHFKSLLLVTNNLSSWRSYSFVKRSQFAASFAHNLPVADRDFINSSTHFCPRRFESVKSEKMANNVDDNQALELPEGKVKFTPKLRFISETADERECCYRVLDENGNQISSSNYVEYREAGVLLWRGFTIQEFANQCFSNKADYGKGRQMPIHYGSNKHNYVTVASTVATQLPQAVGAAYSLKMEKQDACAIAYVGDGGTSEGDFHAALNFAAVTDAPVIFFCRNNGWAISTPTSDQFRSDGVVVKGRAYGVRSIRVDGNDALAVYSAVHAARDMAIREQRPILIEALTYRVGHHSTSDDSTKYRPVKEIEWWKMEQDPVTRFRNWMENNSWWSDKAESEARNSARKQILHAIQEAEKVDKPPVADIFTDVYDSPPSHLCEQEKLLREAIKRHPQDYPSDVPL
ncbi:2-oxoisovalerate dehydrogenase subunit alpha 2, mitochondrial isoform X1 [Prunus dulcis]|uniref:2-oxoisovalerate dehydrogenase subunit alpha 2, mitochondrial isoform X1 n=1 Tax=Prunus dulcis TaxID=3755 RepID=UPI0014827E64|nr:2-oxoisovalerate dehydrogenase subunit alpha 2, mitochondrial isoform X1 [Prunus dulcis]